MSVSCPKRTWCAAGGEATVGRLSALTLAERWHAGHWTVQATPSL